MTNFGGCRHANFSLLGDLVIRQKQSFASSLQLLVQSASAARLRGQSYKSAPTLSTPSPCPPPLSPHPVRVPPASSISSPSPPLPSRQPVGVRPYLLRTRRQGQPVFALTSSTSSPCRPCPMCIQSVSHLPSPHPVLYPPLAHTGSRVQEARYAAHCLPSAESADTRHVIGDTLSFRLSRAYPLPTSRATVAGEGSSHFFPISSFFSLSVRRVMFGVHFQVPFSSHLLERIVLDS